MLTVVLVALGLAGTGQAAPPPPPRVEVAQPRDPGRRPPPEPVGTGIIRGRVVAADTGTPIRRATVSISMMPPTQPATGGSGGTPVGPATRTITSTANGTTVTFSAGFRSKTVITDAQGGFEFAGLPQGTYRLMGSPAQYSAGYLPMAFGAKRPPSPAVPSDPGTPIDLADGQVFDKATLALPRGAVITGRVTDENGDPLARVQVYTLAFNGASRGYRSGNNASTDDLGQFRLFGLATGEYVVVAEARGNNYVAPNAPPETEDERMGFMTTFYPGTADDASAQRVRARAGAETPGVEIRMISGRLFHLSGMVTDSQGRTSVRVNGTLTKRNPAQASSGSYGFSTDENGRFQMRNIQPGNYRLTVRQQLPPGAPVDDRQQGERGEFASIPLSISADVDDILVTTSPGATITGNIVFETGPPQLTGSQPSQIRVFSVFGDPDNNFGGPSAPSASIAPDFTFTLKGLAGEVVLRTGVPNNWTKAIMLGAEDILDTPHEFKNGDRVTIVMTTRVSTVEGNVTDAAGKPTGDASIVLFSDDKTFWRGSSIRTKRGTPDATGHYRINGLLPGRYILVALPRDRAAALGSMNDAAIFEALSKEGTTVVVGEDEQRQVDVRVSSGGGGY